MPVLTAKRNNPAACHLRDAIRGYASNTLRILCLRKQFLSLGRLLLHHLLARLLPSLRLANTLALTKYSLRNKLRDRVVPPRENSSQSVITQRLRHSEHGFGG